MAEQPPSPGERQTDQALRVPPLEFAHPGGRGERRDAAANREQILAAAQTLFAERGVDAVTMEEIAAAAGVGKGTLYRRYPHKGALCLALLGENALRFADDIAGWARASGSALELIVAFLDRLVAFNEENSALLSAAGDAALGPRRGWLYATPIYRWMRATLQALLGHAIARGEIRPLDPAITADVLLAPFAIDLYQHQRHDLGLSSADILATASDVVLNGLHRR